MNSELYGKTYKLPENVLSYIQSVLTKYPQGDGVRRAKYMLRNQSITYQAMKRLKNFFDTFSPTGDRRQYELAGGDLMRKFIEVSLNQDRDGVERSKEVKRDMNVDVRQGVKPEQSLTLNEGANDGAIEGVKKNALAVIINNDKQLLLLRRSPNKEYWGAGKWALVGGGVEEGETPLEACQREIWEETKLQINKFKEKFTIQRNPDSVEYIFIAKYDGDPFDVKLNDEHTNYGWYDPEEIYFLNHVPNLVEYVKLAFEKYD